jgi:hypothetical protein
VNTGEYDNGPMIIEVIAHDSVGDQGVGAVNVSVENIDQGEVLGNLGMNIIAGATVSIALVSALTLLVLWARERKGGA